MTGECRTVDPHGQKSWRVNELAGKLGVNAKWLTNRIDRGQIASQKQGAMRVIAQAEAQRLIDMKERGVLESGTSAHGDGAVAKKPTKKTAKKPAPTKQAVHKMVKHAERVVERLQAGDAKPIASPAEVRTIEIHPAKLCELMNLYVALSSQFAKLNMRIGLTAF